ncbi:cathepsin W isoform 2-T8 [Erethizon dorsatum]
MKKSQTLGKLHSALNHHGSECPSPWPPGPVGGRPSPRHQGLPRGPEYTRRLDIFVHNIAKAQRLQEEDLGTAEFGVTPFSDLTEEEFGQLYGNWRAARKDLRMARKVSFEKQEELMPQSCDWRKAPNIISSVKNQVPALVEPNPAQRVGNERSTPPRHPTMPYPITHQGNCRCCWAIAAAGNIEAVWNIKFKKSVEVSVQELLDCGRCGDGCMGGYVWDAFITVLNYSGLASERDYPFRGHANIHRCLAPNYTKVAWIYDFIMLPGNEHTIASYVAMQGPITVIINSKLLQHYKKGIIKGTPSTCDPWFADHYVLLVGFGRSKVEEKWTEKDSSHSNRPPRRSTPYWTLKNSWGADWGEEGYFRLHRGSNTCGITKYPITARVDNPAKMQPVSCPP